MKRRVLIWEPDVLQAEYLSYLYTEAGFEAQSFQRFRSFKTALQSHPQEILLIVFALSDPLPRSLNHCTRLRQAFPLASLVILSHYQGQQTCLEALATGADDYMVKPFQADELLARSHSHLRRNRDVLHASLSQIPAPLDCKSFRLLPADKSLEIADQKIPLSPNEYKLMQVFSQHPQALLSRQYLAQRIWQTELPPQSRKIDNLILALRKKLPQSIHFESRYGQGYALKFSEKQDD